MPALTAGTLIMRPSLVLAAAGFVATSLSVVAVAQPFEPPTRRSGYWDQTITGQAGGRSRTMTSQFCTDPTVEKQNSVVGTGAGRTCAKREFHRIPTGFSFSTVCTVSGMTRESRGTVSGDFQSHYHMDVVSTASGDPVGERRTSIDSKWLGPCPAGRKPGDMVMSNGMVANVSATRH